MAMPVVFCDHDHRTALDHLRANGGVIKVADQDFALVW